MADELGGKTVRTAFEDVDARERERKRTIAAGRVLCRHCNTHLVNRLLGLWWACYYTPGVKDLYPSTSKYARRGVGNVAGDGPLPAEPTDAPPGSLEKMRVMYQRAVRGEQLHHPLDNGYVELELLSPFQGWPSYRDTDEPTGLE